MSVSPTRFVRRSRVGFLFSIVLVVSAIFVVQLFVVQVVRHDYYVKQADNEQIKKFTLKAQRGEIYAMDGSDPKPLVMKDRKSTRLNSSHRSISYAVFCLKKKTMTV